MQSQGASRALDTSNLLETFRRDGYVTIPGFFSEAEMDKLIVDIQTADPKREKPSGLNKDGMLFYSNLFYKSKTIQDFITQSRLVDFLKTIVGPDFWVRWDQAVFKGPDSPEFPWHQDNAYNRLPVEHFQLWIALSKMTPERGGLFLVPGSHTRGVLPHKRVGNHQVFSGDTEGSICVDAEKGDLVLFSSMMLHYTSPNTSTNDRWAYVIEYMKIDDRDPHIEAPFFVAARNGKPNPSFVKYPNGPVRYLSCRVKESARRVKNGLGRRLGALLHLNS